MSLFFNVSNVDWGVNNIRDITSVQWRTDYFNPRNFYKKYLCHGVKIKVTIFHYVFSENLKSRRTFFFSRLIYKYSSFNNLLGKNNYKKMFLYFLRRAAFVKLIKTAFISSNFFITLIELITSSRTWQLWIFQLFWVIICFSLYLRGHSECCHGLTGTRVPIHHFCLNVTIPVNIYY